MATKLKTYKVKRIIALLIAILMIFTSGIFICYVVKGTAYYNSYIQDGTYFDTNVFRYNFNSLAYGLYRNGESESCETVEEYINTNEGSSAYKDHLDSVEKIKTIIEYFDAIGLETVYFGANDNDGAYVEGGSFYKYSNAGTDWYFTVDGNEVDDLYAYSIETITMVENSTNKVDYEQENDNISTTTISNDVKSTDMVSDTTEVENSSNEKYTEASIWINDEVEFSNHQYVSKSKICIGLNEIRFLCNGKKYKFNTNEELISSVDKSNIKNSMERRKWYFDSISNNIPSIKYAIYYSSTGKWITNCGVNEKDDNKAISQKLEFNKADYYEGISNGKTVSSQKAAPKFEKGFFADLGNGFNPGNIAISEGDRAYFSYTYSDEYADTLTVSQNAYNSFVASNGSKSLAFSFTVAIITFIIALLSIFYLFAIAGKTDNGEIKLKIVDYIPFGIKALIDLLISSASLTAIAVISYYEAATFKINENTNYHPNNIINILCKPLSYISNVVTALLFVLCIMVLVAMISSVIRNVRNKSFKKRIFLFMIIHFIYIVLKKIRGFFHKILEKIKNIYAKDYAYGNGKKFIIIISVVASFVTVFNFIITYVCGVRNREGLTFLWLMANIVIIGYIIYLAICFDRIASGIAEIKLGSLTCNINTRFMPGFMRSMAEDVSKIREGLQSAVNQAMKDQSMKTELITNVTHDLKTPLTSIITYVDLLKNTTDAQEQEKYLEILDEKSQKLKKLIDDLVQASKASSGAIEINLQQLNLNEFAQQLSGEYTDEFKEKNIEIVLKKYNTPVIVNADQQVTQRIFENLITNMRKYALTGSRAFIEVLVKENYGVVVFKNISANPIDDDASRLKERFYRADASRTGEGSGLGLSIADNLCVAQGGKFELDVDTDVFKAYVYIPLA